MANTKFVVDTVKFGEYSTFLKKTTMANTASVNKIGQNTKALRATLQDEVTAKVEKHILNLKKIFKKFDMEVDSLSKYMKKEQLLYERYNSSKR